MRVRIAHLALVAQRVRVRARVRVRVRVRVSWQSRGSSTIWRSPLTTYHILTYHILNTI